MPLTLRRRKVSAANSTFSGKKSGKAKTVREFIEEKSIGDIEVYQAVVLLVFGYACVNFLVDFFYSFTYDTLKLQKSSMIDTLIVLFLFGFIFVFLIQLFGVNVEREVIFAGDRAAEE